MTADPSPLLFASIVRDTLIRFYRSPLLGPDMPWVVLDDVVLLLSPQVSLPTDPLRIWREEHPEFTRQVSTKHGTVTVVPEIAALGLINRLADLGWSGMDSLRDDYQTASAEAFCVASCHLSRADALTILHAAMERWDSPGGVAGTA